jgi:BlaR1 peptidase M56
MPAVVDRLGAALLDASLAAIAISGLVVLVMVQCRQPARRRGWARAGLLSTLALLPLAALNLVPRIDLGGPIQQILPTALDDPSPRPRSSREKPPRPALASVIDQSLRPDCHVEAALEPRIPQWVRWIARGMVVAYGVGVLIGLGWILLGVWGSAWVVRRSRPASLQSLGLALTLPFEGGFSRPRLLVSERATRPVLVGFLRPVILIPPGFDRPKAAEQLRLSLLHELAHAEQYDHLFGPGATLARAIWFFLPPVGWIRDQMRLDQEFLADRRAVDHYGTSGSYASSLVDLASAVAPDLEEGPASSAIQGAADVHQGLASSLVQRVQMLLKCPFAIEGQTPLWWRWSTAMTLVLVTLAASCLTLRGMAGWLGSTPALASESDRSFQIPQLVVTQREHDEQPFDLRFRLPEQFALTFEVLAEPDDLPTLEFLGHHLGPPASIDLDPTRTVYRLWHPVEIRRIGGSETVKVDNQALPPEPKLTKLSTWLTMRALPGQTIRLRDLELLW